MRQTFSLLLTRAVKASERIYNRDDECLAVAAALRADTAAAGGETAARRRLRTTPREAHRALPSLTSPHLTSPRAAGQPRYQRWIPLRSSHPPRRYGRAAPTQPRSARPCDTAASLPRSILTPRRNGAPRGRRPRGGRRRFSSGKAGSNDGSGTVT